MENYYEILGVSQFATQEEIKKAFQKLALVHHPDKDSSDIANSPDCDQVVHESNDSNKIVDILRAWKVLSDPELRRQYDSVWFQRYHTNTVVIHDVVRLADLTMDKNGDYAFECSRCGGGCTVCAQDVSFRVDVVGCDSCSLYYEILYSYSW